MGEAMRKLGVAQHTGASFWSPAVRRVQAQREAGAPLH